MFPELLHIGPLTLHTYGLMVALGMLAGITLAEYLNRKQGGEPGRIVDLSLIVILSGLLGARTLFIIINLSYYQSHPLEMVMVWKGGLVFFGGLIGGLIGLLVAILIYRMPLWRTLDIAAPGLTLGHALGRIGCFSAGCGYGRPTDLPWAVIFTDPRSLATGVLGIPVHPTQLYSSLALLILTVFLVWKTPRRRFDGQIAALYIIIYCIFRFGVEFLRGDPRGGAEIMGFFLSTSQIVSLVLLPLGLLFYFLRSQAGERD
ncbi:MAG: prolipoprotein diacylglyceryl transferase [Deltaproteobacteria bacterium]|nr:prolipoprotein diacylglyceryl transferase [Deltaproteobacteria bacterium]